MTQAMINKHFAIKHEIYYLAIKLICILHQFIQYQCINRNILTF